MRVDVAVDLETLSTDNKPAIVQIAAVHFDIKSGNILRKFKLEINLDSCTSKGLNISSQTLNWWFKQSKSLIESVFQNTTKLELALKSFNEWLNAVSGGRNSVIYLWGNGILADNTWLKSAYEACNMKYPIQYKNDRDVRTLVDLTAVKYNKTHATILEQVKFRGIKHNALDDAIWTSELITNCFNNLIT